MTHDVRMVVEVDFDEVIGMTVDDFNDYLCDLTREPCLQGISWEVSGLNDGLIALTVSGYVDEEE